MIPQLPSFSPGNKRIKIGPTALSLSAESDPATTESFAQHSNHRPSSASAPLGKKQSKQSSIRTFMENQLKSTAKRIEFILENAPTTTPLGYLYQTKLAEEKAVSMKDAADGDWLANYDLAHQFKLERNDLLASAAMEKKLFTECTWVKDYAESKIEQFRKMENFLGCKEMEYLAVTAAAYLRDVPDDDVEVFSEILQSSLSAEHLDKKNNGGDNVEMVDVEDSTSNGLIISVSDDNFKESVESVDAEVLSHQLEEGRRDEEDNEDTANQDDNTADNTKLKAKGARDRAPKVYVSAKMDISPKKMKKPPKLANFHAFVAEKSHKVFHKEIVTIVDVSQEHYILSHGYLFCNCCKIAVDCWGNWSKHLVAQKHIKSKINAETVAQDLERAKPMLQQRIKEDSLVGWMYSDEKLKSTIMWLKIAFAGNWSTRSVEDTRVSSLSSIATTLFHCTANLTNASF